jgi:hypothetical protein
MTTKASHDITRITLLVLVIGGQSMPSTGALIWATLSLAGEL